MNNRECLLLIVVSLVSADTSASTIARSYFGLSLKSVPVELYTLRNDHGMEARIATFGGTIVSLNVKDRAGKFADVVLGYETLEPYLRSGPYFGPLIGRFANRIAHGTFRLNGTTYTLATNDGPNALHGGVVGFGRVVWKVVKAEVSRDGPRLTLSYFSHDGEEGYPGDLSVTAVYTLTENDTLHLDYEATTDSDTIVNLTQHSYFNLRGFGDVLGHEVQINATQFTPTDATLIPTGELRPVAGTPFDFRTPTRIGARIHERDGQLLIGKGFDHNWIIDQAVGNQVLAATVYEPQSGRVLKVISTEPGLQFYSGNRLDGAIVGKGGQKYQAYAGFCLEPQHFPDSPNHPNFPSTVLKRGEVYHSTIIYSFTTR